MLRTYVKNVSGNIAATFAVSLLMLMTVIGAAIDYNSMTSKKVTYQSLADIAVLAAARSGENNRSKLEIIAAAAVDGNNFSGDTLETKLSITKEGRIQVNVSGTYDTVMMSLFGKPHQIVNALAEAPIAVSEPVDIALVLDTTGSMSGSKIDSLKVAATGLVKQLEGFENGSVRISVIPFSEYVNVGLSRRYEPWISVPEDGIVFLPEKCKIKRDVISKTNCKTTYYNSTCKTSDGGSYSCKKKRTKCDYTYGPEYEYCYIPKKKVEWYGCVGSRQTPWNERSHKGAALIPGLMNEKDCPKEILPLTKDMSAVRAKINSLKADDKTYLPAGLIWGWRALHPQAPLTEASTAKAQNKSSVLIFMTDGANTVSQKGELHNGKNIAQANRQTKQLCNNIKSDRIQIYTVAYSFNNENTLDILRKCASKTDMFFLASNAAGLKQAFEDIGTSLLKLRLTH